MQQLLYFIQKYKYFLFFLLLQIIAFALIINNHSYHRSKFVSSASFITGGLYEKKSNLNSYLNLRKENNDLIQENLALKNKLEKFKSLLDSVEAKTLVDTDNYNQQFEYINGRVYKNEFHKPYNYITINRGEKHGVKEEMAIVNDKGIIGMTDDASSNYARVRSILNRNSKINARFKNSGYFGSLSWNGENHNIVQLLDIPREAKINIGDTIITGGNSAIFPKGILIGTVLSNDGNINIKLFNDMSNLDNIYIIKNFHQQEIKAVENKNDE